MAQNQTVKYIDITRSYLPMNPNSFPDGLQIADMREEDRVPVMAYEARNVMPTSYGYKSFFGLDTAMPFDPLPLRLDAVFVFQTLTRKNILIALGASGLYYKAGAEVDNSEWTHAVQLLDETDTGKYYPWSYCVLASELYCYRANGEHVYKISTDADEPDEVKIESLTPTFLNMEAQMGVFRAGNRLGMWDSDSSVAWSSLDNLLDFEPDLKTLAGSSKFSDVTGSITTILNHGNGFLIYSTQSVVYVQSDPDGLFLWKPSPILEGSGVAYPNQVAVGVPDTVHFVYSTTGLYTIQNAAPEVIVPEVYDFFKTFKGPKYLKLMGGRYLFVHVMAEDFINAFPQYSTVAIPGLSFTLSATSMEEAYNQYLQGVLSFPQYLEIIQTGTFNQPPVGGGPGPGPGGDLGPIEF
jgi:hypothetical protein